MGPMSSFLEHIPTKWCLCQGCFSIFGTKLSIHQVACSGSSLLSVLFEKKSSKGDSRTELTIRIESKGFQHKEYNLVMNLSFRVSKNTGSHGCEIVNDTE